jgi:hypothetical protein
LISWIQRSPDGTFSIDVASAGSMNPGKSALTPIAAGFFRWNATINSPPLTGGFKRMVCFVPEAVREPAHV